jgi:hypothetical protein
VGTGFEETTRVEMPLRLPTLPSASRILFLVSAALPVLLVVWLAGTGRTSEALLPSMIGEIGAYDATTRALTLTTPSGTVRLVLAPGAPVWQGARTLEAKDLQARLGLAAKVRFSPSADGPIARFVSVARPDLASATTLAAR